MPRAGRLSPGAVKFLQEPHLAVISTLMGESRVILVIAPTHVFERGMEVEGPPGRSAGR